MYSYSYSKHVHFVIVDLITKPGTMIQNGTDITCTIQIRNISNRPSTVNATVVVNTMEYTGRTKALVKRKKLENISIPAGESTLKYTNKPPSLSRTSFIDSQFTLLVCIKNLQLIILDTFDSFNLQ